MDTAEYNTHFDEIVKEVGNYIKKIGYNLKTVPFCVWLVWQQYDWTS